MLAFLAGEAFRDLRRAGRVAASATALIMLSLTAAGAFWIVSANLGHAIARWRESVRVIVYLRQEPAAPAALVETVGALPGVASVRYVSKAEALASLRQALGRDAAVAEQLAANPLPASLEVMPAAEAATREGARALMTTLAGLPDADEVAGGTEWVERLAHWQRLLRLLGLGLGGVLAVAAILTVTTATTLVLHARRHETEIMRLVGAPEFAIRVPLVLQGGIQGLLGALVAVGILVLGHRLLAPRLEPLASITLGLSALAFLTPAALGGLVGAGTVLGGLGGFLARGPREARR